MLERGRSSPWNIHQSYSNAKGNDTETLAGCDLNAHHFCQESSGQHERIKTIRIYKSRTAGPQLDNETFIDIIVMLAGFRWSVERILATPFTSMTKMRCSTHFMIRCGPVYHCCSRGFLTPSMRRKPQSQVLKDEWMVRCMPGRRHWADRLEYPA